MLGSQNYKFDRFRSNIISLIRPKTAKIINNITKKKRHDLAIYTTIPPVTKSK